MDKLSSVQHIISAPDQHQQIRRKIETGGTGEFAKQFESIFLRQMIQQMNKSMLSDGLFGESHQGKIYQGMFTDAMAETLAENGGIGLADVLEQSLGDGSQAGKSGPENGELNSRMYKLTDRDYLSHTKAEQRKEEL